MFLRWPTAVILGVFGRSASAFVWSAMFLLAFAGAARANTPNVVVTIKPIHALVAQVMEGVGEPRLLVDGSASPHTFSLRPSTARAINGADVFIRVSEAIEPFTRKIVSTLSPNVTVLTLADAPGVRLLDRRAGGTFETHAHSHEGHEAHDEHQHEGHAHTHAHDLDDAAKDGHIWLDLENAKAIVADVSATLAKRFPEHASRIEANAAALEKRIDGLKGELAAVLASASDRPFVVFHDSTQYFEKGFDVHAAGSITVSPDVPPSARRLTDVRRKIASLGAVCVFSEPSFQPKLVEAVTEGTEARSGTLDTEAQLLTPGPDLYFELMRGLAKSLAGCLSSQS
ncbi:zinc ABC transporter substrate-binding protein [Hyphomicrobium methylovorum]|uniref:zinc ABC transporter substrate-binding protein n=1 Tax=Hyphomicrobium methylovorum TaxID=84 RepID=UPI0015E7B9F6|nr:zinc ABC transporter substrate-binding protein [Hyphomicrobium methylovorum]MBA2126615.1 zinc ABC transporter substrate-binding protein [Hyphomicrobium methylovorum]